jgi:ABC-type lipoprotein export system ATPase subunit/ABC-type lipoprotein release transport system permease subunit
VNLSLPDTGMVFIVGKSGCGKTTLLNVLGGLDKFDSGEMHWGDKLTSQFSPKDWDKYRNSYASFVFQESNLLDEYNVFENIKIALNFQGNRNATQAVVDCLNSVGLAGFEQRKTSELSGGQKQRIAIARALVKNSKMLLTDEPTGNLDKATSQEIFELLKEISSTKLVIVVTHDMEAATIYADNILEMSDGVIVHQSNQTSQTIASVQPQLIKSRINPKTYALLATKSFIKTPIRLFVLVMLTTFAFSLMVGSFKFAFWQPYSVQEQVLASFGYAMVQRTPIITEANGMGRSEMRYFSEQDLNEFRAKYTNVKTYNLISEELHLTNAFVDLTERQCNYYTNRVNGRMRLTENDFQYFGATLLAGEYPNETWTDNAIAISKYAFEVYRITSYTPSNYEVVIDDYTDILGKEVDGFIVRGVIDTQFDRAEFSAMKEYALGQNDRFTEARSSAFSSYMNTGLHNVFFAKPNKVIAGDSLAIFVPFDQKTFESNNFIKDICDSEDYEFADYYSQILSYQSQNSKKFGGTMFVIALIVTAFACILFANFIVISINDKMKQIGILRALGASKGDITVIFVLQNILISILIFITSAIAVYYAILPLLILMGTSHTVPFPWYVLTVSDYLILFAIIVVTSVLSSLLPLLKLARRTPRQVIDKNKRGLL